MMSVGGTNVRYSAQGFKDLFLKKVLAHQCATAWLVNTAYISQLLHMYEWGISRHRWLPFFRDWFADHVWSELMKREETRWFMTYPTPWVQQRPGVSRSSTTGGGTARDTADVQGQELGALANRSQLESSCTYPFANYADVLYQHRYVHAIVRASPHLLRIAIVLAAQSISNCQGFVD